MEVEVKEALKALTTEDTQMSAHQVLGLQDRLRIVDEKFVELRREISRLNAALNDEKELNNIIRKKVEDLTEENSNLKSENKKKASVKPGQKTSKKKTTKKKK
tara:strand:- start:169 stop:477 length:309 start_codon:yes stop_codon:yes gene_type:complete